MSVEYLEGCLWKTRFTIVEGDYLGKENNGKVYISRTIVYDGMEFHRYLTEHGWAKHTDYFHNMRFAKRVFELFRNESMPPVGLDEIEAAREFRKQMNEGSDHEPLTDCDPPFDDWPHHQLKDQR